MALREGIPGPIGDQAAGWDKAFLCEPSKRTRIFKVAIGLVPRQCISLTPKGGLGPYLLKTKSPIHPETSPVKILSRPICALATGALLAVGSLASTPSESMSVDLSFRTLRTWDVHLPAETFMPIGKSIPLAAVGEAGLSIAIEEGALRIDRDGDGEFDGRVETPDEETGSRLVVFRLDAGTPEESSFAVRVANKGRWSYGPAGAMEGTAGNTRFMVFDQNGNGRFDDYGVDAMIVGRGKTAGFLSHTIHVDGELMDFAITPNGRNVSLTPYNGSTGKLDLGSNLDTKAKMRSVVVNSKDGKQSFELSRALGNDGGLKVPTGEYLMHSGQVVLGKSTADMKPGRAKAIAVTEGQIASLTWGGPVSAEFAYARLDSEVQIAPGDILYYGSAGEQYSNFMPLGSSPNFAVKDAETGKVLINAVFPGNC